MGVSNMRERSMPAVCALGLFVAACANQKPEEESQPPEDESALAAHNPNLRDLRVDGAATTKESSPPEYRNEYQYRIQ